MSDCSSRRQGLPIVFACTLAASLGGCSTFGMPDLFGLDSRASCSSDSWPTQVMGSVQRAETPWVTRRYPAEERYEPTDDNEAAPVERYEPPERIAKESAEPVIPSPPAAQEIPEPPVAKEPTGPVAETPPAAAPPPPPEQPPAVTPPAEQPPEPAAPPPSQPSPDVVKACGAADTACQDALTTLLADPAHKWIRAQPTPDEERTGVRILAYRILAPTLACEDLRWGLLETLAETGENQPEAPPPEATEGSKNLAWVQLLRRQVEQELRAEIAKRCS